MSHETYANGMEIAGKAGANKSIARFPDVCLSSPAPPAGPIPVPYADSSTSSDLKEGSETVKLGGKPGALAQKSYLKPSTLGNEAATRSFGMSVLTHQLTGKTYFQAWSMDVEIEGKSVCRHLDLTSSNHASYPGGTPPMSSLEKQAIVRLARVQCPCCGGEAAQCPGALPSTFSNGENREAMSFREFYRLDEQVLEVGPEGEVVAAGPSRVAAERKQVLSELSCTGGSCPNAGRSEPKCYRPRQMMA